MRLWDISSGKCVRTFIAKSEVNAVCMFPNGGAIAYATEQGQFGLFDVGSYACVSEGKTASKGAAMSVAVSRSGRVTYVGFEKGAISVCDTFDMSQYDGVTSGHERCACSVYGRPRAPTNIPTDPNPHLILQPNPNSNPNPNPNQERGLDGGGAGWHRHGHLGLRWPRQDMGRQRVTNSGRCVGARRVRAGRVRARRVRAGCVRAVRVRAVARRVTKAKPKGDQGRLRSTLRGGVLSRQSCVLALASCVARVF